VSEFFLGAALTICRKRFAARSDMLMDISLPSSSVRGLCLATVAHDILDVEKQRVFEVSERALDAVVAFGRAGRGIVLVADLVRQAWKKAAGS